MFITTLWIAFRLEKDYLTKLTHALGEKIKNDSILDRLRAIIWNGRAGNCSQNNHKPKPDIHGIAHSNNKHGMKRKVKFWCLSRLKGETCYFTYIKFMTLLINIFAPIVDNLFSLHAFTDYGRINFKGIGQFSFTS